MNASGTESTCTTCRFSEAVSLNDFWINDAFANQLSDAITFFDIEINVRVIEQNHANIAAVVLVNDASTNIDEILPCQSRAWCDTSICSIRHFDLNVSLYQCFSASRHNEIVCTAIHKEKIMRINSYSNLCQKKSIFLCFVLNNRRNNWIKEFTCANRVQPLVQNLWLVRMHVRSILPSEVSIRLQPFTHKIKQTQKLPIVVILFGIILNAIHWNWINSKWLLVNWTYILMKFLDFRIKTFTLKCAWIKQLYAGWCAKCKCKIYATCVFAAIFLRQILE